MRFLGGNERHSSDFGIVSIQPIAYIGENCFPYCSVVSASTVRVFVTSMFAGNAACDVTHKRLDDNRNKFENITMIIYNNLL